MRIFGLISLALLLSGCELIGLGESESVYARMNRETYRTGEPVTYSLANESYKPVSFAYCSGLVYQLERLEGRAWVFAGGTRHSICVGTFPLKILPLQTVEGEVTISAPGTYRLGFIRYVDKDVGEVYTNTFRVSDTE